jgi:hypothetical protein
MSKFVILMSAVLVASAAWGVEPVIDNEHVTVWDTSSPLPPSSHDFVAVSLSHKGHATFGHQGDIPGKAGVRTIVVELKGLPVPPLPNDTGYPLAFPRKGAKKLLENDEVVVWDYVWQPGKATPMHFHDKDAVVVHEEDGVLNSTTPDGKSSIAELKFGKVRFNPSGNSHTEILVSGKAHAVITELK